MSSNLDKSLDDIIASKPRTKRFGGIRKFKKPVRSAASAKVAGRRGQKAANTTAPTPANKQKVQAVAAAAGLGEATALADRVIMSNLPTDVTESSVRKYFTHQIGPVATVQATYDKKGNQTGVFSLTFKRPGDAAKAVTQFNGTSIDDGAKTMKVELVVDPSKRPLSSRLNPPPVQRPTAPKGKAAKAKPVSAAAKKDGPKGNKRERRPKKTIEELDAEMADYFQDATTA